MNAYLVRTAATWAAAFFVSGMFVTAATSIAPVL
jgi:hypothetical protein